MKKPKMMSKISFSFIVISLFLGLALATLDEGTYHLSFFPFHLIFETTRNLLTYEWLCMWIKFCSEIGSVEFSYSGPHGPSNWGKMEPAFSTCSSGKNQSPVNIKKNETVFNNNLKPLYKQYTAAAANATLINFCHVIGVYFFIFLINFFLI